MKRIIVLILLVASVTTVNAQKRNRTSAFNYHRNGKLDKAKEYIDKALDHEQTMNDARTWYYAGNIYLDIYRSDDPEVKNLDKNALDKSYNAYMKTLELDEDKEYFNELIPRILLVGEEYFNKGANNFNQGLEANKVNKESEARQHFNNAVTAFERAIEAYARVGSTDTTSYYYMAYAADQAGDHQKAEKNYLKLVNEFNYETPAIYNSLFNIYLQEKNDTARALEFVREGRTKFPNDLALLIEETNVYLARNETDKAMENLNKAMEIDPDNPTIFFAVGSIIDKEVLGDTTKTTEVRMNAFERAKNAYETAIEINPEYFDPIYNIGAMYVNRAASISEEANQLPLEEQEEYERLTAEADSLLKVSLPYLEKAHEIMPDDLNTLIALKEIYTRLNMMEQLQEINAKLEERQGGN